MNRDLMDWKRLPIESDIKPSLQMNGKYIFYILDT